LRRKGETKWIVVFQVGCINGKGDDVCFAMAIGAKVKGQVARSVGGQAIIRIDDQKQFNGREARIVRNESLAHSLGAGDYRSSLV